MAAAARFGALYDRPMKALSIRQPWAHLVVTGRKRVENRAWATRYRGPLIIHAGVRWTDEPIDEIENRHDIRIPRDLPRGGIVGLVDLVDIVRRSDDPYFTGPLGWVFANARVLPFRPVVGRLGLFETDE
jgi:hypothetical protein